MWSMLKTLGVRFLTQLLPVLLPMITSTFRDMIVGFSKKWYEKAQMTPSIIDDYAASLFYDLAQLIEGNVENFIFDDELRGLAYRLYAYSKTTKSPLDDIMVGFIFMLLNIETPQPNDLIDVVLNE